MPRKLLSSAAVLVAIVVVVVGVLLLTRGPSRRTSLPAEVEQALGAAAYVPESVSGYSAHMHLAASWKEFWNSRAVQSLVALPLVQELWMNIRYDPGYLSFVRATETEPFFVEFIPILEDAVSTEVFACTGPEFPEFLTAFSEVLNSMRFARIQSGIAGPRRREEPSSAAATIAAVVENAKQLQMPPVLLGFKLTKPDAARKFLASWIPKIGPTPYGTFTEKSLGAGSLHVLELHGETMFLPILRGLPRELRRQGVPDAHIRRFLAWLADIQITIGVGMLNDYLVLSLGRDTSLAAQWGKGAPVAGLPDLAPLAAAYKPGLQSFSYTSAKMAEIFAFTPNDLRRFADGLADAIPPGPTTNGLKERIHKDLDSLLKDADPSKSKSSSTLTCSFRNQGIESLSFGGAPDTGGLDYSLPLSILAHRTKQPILFSASRAAKSPPGAYDQAVKWLRVFFGYFQDYVVPTMDRETRKHYDTVMEFARPFLAEINEANRTCLVPALDGAQYLFVLDGNGTLAAFPDGRKPPKPIPLPRLGLAIMLADPGKFVKGIERYDAAIRKLIEDAREAYPKQVPPEFALPQPVVADTTAGKQAYYPLKWNLGQDVFPCALLKGNLLILSSSSNLAREMTEALPLPTSRVTGPDKAAGAVSGADLVRAWDYAGRLSDALFDLAASDRTAYPKAKQEMVRVRMHLDALWRALGALRSYSSTTTVRDGRVVTHSWLHVEDIAK